MNLWDGFEPVFQEYQNFQPLTYHAWKQYRDMYQIVRQVSRYISYRELTVSLQPYNIG